MQRLTLAALFSFTLLVACGDEPVATCVDSTGCPTGQRCVDGECEEIGTMDGSTDDAASDTGSDTGGGTDGGGDAGPSCTPADCNDDNVCTDNRCTDLGCENTNNTSACDDGMFCNGPDSCLDGACSVNAGDPCGALTCDESSGSCMGDCTMDSDCPADVEGAWTSCVMAGSDVCDETGTRSRDVASFTCTASMCVGAAATETESCTLSTDGTRCDDGSDCSTRDRCLDGECTGLELCPPGCSCNSSGRGCFDDRTGVMCKEF